MNKAELINYVADQVDELSKATAARAVNAVFAAIKHGLKQDGLVAIVGHGAYSAKVRAERKVRHPRNGEYMLIPATNQVKFKVGKDLKDEVNKDAASGSEESAT